MQAIVKEDEFFDRWGRGHIPDESDTQIKRVGAFSVLLSAGKILLVWPKSSPEVPELPGGGVDDGETLWQALIREIAEETGLDLARPEVQPQLTQRVQFYAENQNEYWHYDQFFYKLDGAAIDDLYFDGQQDTPEDGVCQWIRLEDLADVNLHHMHRIALNRILSKG